MNWGTHFLSFFLHDDWISLHQCCLRYICHTLEHIKTKNDCRYTCLGEICGISHREIDYKLCIWISLEEGPRMALDVINHLLQKLNRFPNYLLPWIYFTCSWVPGGEVWLRWCHGVKGYKASTISKSAGFSAYLFFWAMWPGKISIFSVP